MAYDWNATGPLYQYPVYDLTTPISNQDDEWSTIPQVRACVTLCLYLSGSNLLTFDYSSITTTAKHTPMHLNSNMGSNSTGDLMDCPAPLNQHRDTCSMMAQMDHHT